MLGAKGIAHSCHRLCAEQFWSQGSGEAAAMPGEALPVHRAMTAPAIAIMSAGGRARTKVWGINGSPGRCWLEAGGCTWGCSQAEKQPLSRTETFLNYYYYFL